MANTNVGRGRILTVIFSCLIGLMAGLIYTWSIWVGPITAEYGWDTDAVALMGNVMLATFVFGVTIGGILMPKFGPRVSSFIGTVCFGGFFIISAFVTSPVLMYITYGGVAGIGVGILYLVGQFAASAWFPDRRGLVMGIFLAIFGLSVTVFTPLINSMLGSMGVHSTMLIIGIMVAVVCLVGSFFMSAPPAGWTPKGYVAASADAKPSDEKFVTVGEALRTRDFWFVFLAYALLVWPYSFISSYVAVFVTEEKMLAASAAALAVSCTGIGSAVGRFLGGALVDKAGPKLTYLIMCVCSVVGCLALIPAGSSGLIAALFIVICIGYGGRTPVYGVIFGKLFGQKYASTLYGWGTLSTAVPLVVAPLVTAALRRSTGSFNASCIVATIITVIGCLFFMALPKKTPVERKNGD